MPCVNMNAVLPKARREGYGVGAFNILDYASTRAVVQAAEENAAPVIIQTSPKTVQFWGCGTVAAWYRELAEKTGVSVVLHLDHCKDLEVIRRCIDAGWTSVMIDASSRPFEENLELTAKVIQMASPAGVTVEAELGEIKGVEEDVAVSSTQARLADPQKAALFCRSLSLDLLAPAIGTAHGIYKGEPRIAFDRLEEIARLTGLPLALHGGTGLSAEVFTRCIALGCAKVNISTSLKHVFIDSFVSYQNSHPQEYEPVKHLGFQLEELKKDVTRHIRLFGGAGMA
jgi:ketose-bisphosphate aldolase